MFCQFVGSSDKEGDDDEDGSGREEMQSLELHLSFPSQTAMPRIGAATPSPPSSKLLPLQVSPVVRSLGYGGKALHKSDVVMMFALGIAMRALQSSPLKKITV